MKKSALDMYTSSFVWVCLITQFRNFLDIALQPDFSFGLAFLSYLFLNRGDSVSGKW